MAHGFFKAVVYLLEHGELSPGERADLESGLVWLDAQFEDPKHPSKDNGASARSSSISWFKSTAEDKLETMSALRHTLQNHGVNVKVDRREALEGKPLFEDEHQVVMEKL